MSDACRIRQHHLYVAVLLNIQGQDAQSLLLVSEIYQTINETTKRFSLISANTCQFNPSMCLNGG